MITRGHYIGEIVDELAGVATQVGVRNRLGLTDLSVYAENFFRDLLNTLLKTKLRNLNADRSNEPGLDLGDESAELAVQITATNSLTKVNKTLDKITDEQAKLYKKFIILIIGKRRPTYKIDESPVRRLGFSDDDIWDLDTLVRKALALEIDDLQAAHRVVRSNVVRLKVELEIPDEDGKYPTSGFDSWEPKPSPKIGDGRRFMDFIVKDIGGELTEKDKLKIRDAISELGRKLVSLPRITREFLAMLLEHREAGSSRRSPMHAYPHLILPKVERQYLGDDLKGELSILEHAGLLSIDGEGDHDYGPPEIFIRLSRNEDLAYTLTDYVEKRDLTFRQVIGAADLSAF